MPTSLFGFKTDIWWSANDNVLQYVYKQMIEKIQPHFDKLNVTAFFCKRVLQHKY